VKTARASRVAPRPATRPTRSTTSSVRDGAGARARVAGALATCTAREQLVLVLMLVERLTPAEAASALGLTARQVDRAYHAALADLRHALRRPRIGRLSRAIARRSLELAVPLRKAS